jgi:hypothetical protein
MATVHRADRTLAALSLAIGEGHRLDVDDIDLADPQQCRFGAYTLVEAIGTGGAGLVFRAHQASLERDVAIKLLNVRLSDEAMNARFRLEARSAAALNHPNIVQILEIGEEQGVAFIAMQLVRGPSLAQALAAGLPTPAATVALMLRLCDAVSYAHRLQLLHLDLKPANVLIDERGEPQVADFGLARRMDPRGQVEAQEVSGTPAYMAPEQVLIKQFRLSAATDVYALGAILYEMLCGRPPHGRGATADVLQRALAGDIPPPRSIAPTVPRDLEAICLKCLALRAADRYPDVEAIAADLRRFAAGLPVSVRSPGALERGRRWFAREPKFAATLVLLLLAAVGGSVVFANLYRDAQRERDGAEGMARLLMEQASPQSPPILPTQPGYRVPIVDCLYTPQGCTSGLNPSVAFDTRLPTATRQRYIDSLRAYVPRIEAWGHPRLSGQLQAAIDADAKGLLLPELARRTADTGTVDGFILAYLMVRESEDAGLDPALAQAWFERGADGATQAWHWQALAQACNSAEPACARVIAQFRVADPDNAAAWLVGLPKVADANADARLVRAAAAARLDTHQDEVLAAGSALATRVLPFPAVGPAFSAAEITLQAWLITEPVPLPVDYCQQAFRERDVPEVHAACRAVFAKVEPSMKPTLLDEQRAATMQMGMATDAAARARAWQRLRDLRWNYSAWSQLGERAQTDPAKMLSSIRALGEHGHFRADVQAAGLPTSAPTEFVTREPLPWVVSSNAPAEGGVDR